MTPRHHPADDELLAYATGAIPPGGALVVQVHLHFCAHCRRTLRFLDGLGGALLSTGEAEPMTSEATGRAAASLDGLAVGPAERPAAPSIAQVVASLRHGAWGPFVPGLEVAPVEGGFEAHETVCLLRCKAGSAVPSHSHGRMERFIVLDGGFGVDDTVYWPGDFIQADDTVVHTPFIPPEGDCLCLFALEDGLVFVDPPEPRSRP